MGAMRNRTIRLSGLELMKSRKYLRYGDRYDGIGFCLGEGSNLGIDLDHCRCPAFTNFNIEIITPWAKDRLNEIGSYAEANPSLGKGIRIFAYGGKLPEHGRNKKLPQYGGDNCRKDAIPAFEIYESGRYLTITGNRIAGTPTDIMSRPEAIDIVHKRIFSDTTDKGKPEIVQPMANMSLTDTLEKAYRSKNGERIKSLYNGNYSDYPSQSEADLALCSHLAYWFNSDAMLIDQVFRSSGLFRSKWNEKHFANGQTYGQSVIEKAIQSNTGTSPPIATKELEIAPEVETTELKAKSKGRIRVMDAVDFMALELPLRENILSPWLPRQGLTMIYALRGLVKHLSASVLPMPCQAVVPFSHGLHPSPVVSCSSMVKCLRLYFRKGWRKYATVVT